MTRIQELNKQIDLRDPRVQEAMKEMLVCTENRLMEEGEFRWCQRMAILRTNKSVVSI